MNCRPGDLAVVVVCIWPENIGGIVRVIAPTGDYHPVAGPEWQLETMQAMWTLEPGNRKMRVGAGYITHAYDGQLRPLRAAEGDDETLTWKCGKAPKVEPVTQPETMSWWPT